MDIDVTDSPVPDAPPAWSLPLTNFEEFLRADDQPDYPMEFWLRLRLSGPLDPERWARSFWELVATQPFLTARLRRAEQDTWELIAGAATPCMLKFEPAPDRETAPRIDLEQQPGLRCWVEHAGEHAVITLQCQHVISDAIGILGWLALVVRHYGQTPPVSPASITLAQLKYRDGQPQSVWQRCLHGPYDILGSAGLLEYIAHHPATLGTPLSTREVAQVDTMEHAESELSFTLTAAETQQLRSAAQRLKVTVNDLLAAALFRVLHHALKQESPQEARRSLRIMIPKSLRDPTSSDWLVANQVGMLFLDRRPGWFNDRWLLWSVQLELTLCKRWDAGRTFLRILDWSRRWFGSMSWLQPTNRATATAVQSNLGEPWGLINWPMDLAATRPLQLEFWPPIRPFTALSLGVSKTQGELTATFNCDRRRLNWDVASKLLQNYRVELDRWMGIDATASAGHS